MVNGPVSDSIQVPAAYGSLRFWRNTSVASLAPGTTATFASGTLGYEWDESLDNNFRPPGLIFLSSTTVNGDPILQDYGSTYATGVATHNLTLYRDPSGALVFGAGTVQWSWGLDSNHDNGSAAPSPAMQQATVNLFADMGVQPPDAAVRSGGGDRFERPYSAGFHHPHAGVRRHGQLRVTRAGQRYGQRYRWRPGRRG